MTLNSDLKARVVRPRELSANEIELWSSFCRRDASLAHAFYSFAFARAIDRVHPHVFVAVIQRRGQVVAFLPFQFQGQLSLVLRAAERVGSNLSDRFGVIAGDDLGAEPANLLGLAHLNSLSYSFLPGDQSRHGLQGQKTTTGNRILLSGGPSEFWANFRKVNSGFGTEIDRKERKCAKELGPLKFTFQHMIYEGELERIIAIKRDQYRRTGASDALASPWKRQLFHEILCNPDPSCTAVISTLYAGETWLASHLGLMSQDVFHHWFPVYNVERSQELPGHILTKHMILAALSCGIRTFDLGEGSKYKDRFGPESYEFGAGFWQARNIGGHVAHIVQSISWRMDRLKCAR